MKTYIKKITIAFALFGFVFQSFARTQYNKNTLVDSDVSDTKLSWIHLQEGMSRFRLLKMFR